MFIDLIKSFIYTFKLSIYIITINTYPIKTIMKIFQHIKSLTQRALHKLLEYVAPNRHKLNDKKTNDSQHRKIKKKRSKKRKSSDNVMLSNSSMNFSKSIKSKRKQRKIPFFGKFINRKQSQSLQELKSQSSQNSQINLGQVVTNEVIVAATGVQIQQGHLFIDKNGLQISAIEYKSSKNDQLNNSAQSDPQILKFILGDQLKQQQENDQEKLQRKIEKKTERKDWWLQALQSEGLSENCAPIENKGDQEQADKKSKSLSEKYKSKTKKIKHENKKRNSHKQKQGIKVIEMIDLVENQDRPRIFHVPLCKPLIL